jgi:hypothetical protein
MSSYTQLPTAVIEEARHEYVILSCAHGNCGKQITLSRVDDLEGSRSEYFAQCPECGKKLRITGDTVNSLPQQLLYEAQDLLKQKRVILAVTAICQAYEVYFSWFLEKHLVYDHFGKKTPLSSRDLDELNQIIRDFHKAVGKWSFEKFRRAFLLVAPIQDEQQRHALLYAIIQGFEPQKDVKRGDGTDPRLEEFKALHINQLRNDCVHHKAVRPTSKDVNSELEKARRLILGDTELSLNWT